MSLTLRLKNKAYHFEITNESGATLSLDATPDIGGENKGLRPMQALASSLAGCSSIDILNILYKQKQEIEDYSVEIQTTRAVSTPAVFTNIHLVISIKGKVDIEKANRAAQLSFEKYCSVSKMLEPACKITYDVKVN